MPSSSETRGSSAPTVSAIHEPNDMPAAQIGRSGKRSCDERERGAKVLHLARAGVERAGAAADAAEIEAQRRDADARQSPSPPDTAPWCASSRRAADADGRTPPPRAARRRARRAALRAGRPGPESHAESLTPSTNLPEHVGELIRLGHRAEVAGALQHDVLRRIADRPGTAASRRPARRDRDRPRR